MGVGVASLQETGDGRRSNLLGEEEVSGKFLRVRRDGGTIVSQTAHGDSTYYLPPPYKGGRLESVGNNHLCGVLPQDTPVS